MEVVLAHTFTLDMFLVLALVLFTSILFVTEWVRLDVAALLVLMILGLTHLVPSTLLFTGFSSDAVIALIGVMIVGAGLDKSGLMVDVARYVIVFSHDKEPRLKIVLMMLASCIAGIMRSVGSVALLLPVVTRVARRTGYSKSMFLMPVAYGAILGSTLTMMGAGPLIVLNGLLANQAFEGAASQPIGMFAVFPVGLILVLVGLLYFAFGKRFVLQRERHERHLPGSSREYFRKTYGVGGELWELRASLGCDLINLSLAQVEALLDTSAAIIGLKIGNRICLPPLRSELIRANTVIAVLGEKKTVQAFADAHGLKISAFITAFVEYLNPAVAGLSEVVVPPSSEILGQQYAELHMRQAKGVQVLAVHREQHVLKGKALQEMILRPGDTLGLYCQWEKMIAFENSKDYVVVTSDYPHEIYRREKRYYALLFFVLALFLIVFNLVALPVAFLVGAVGMIASGVLSIDEAYETITWRTVFVIAGLLPLAIAIQLTQLDAWITHQVVEHIQDMPQWATLAILAVFSTLISSVMSSVTATVILVPLALQVADVMHGSPQMYGLMVALASSNVFMIPNHQANSLVAGPGRYTTQDFLRVGSILTVLYWVVILIIVPLLF